jgi:hypothetical protein
MPKELRAVAIMVDLSVRKKTEAGKPPQAAFSAGSSSSPILQSGAGCRYLIIDTPKKVVKRT